MDYIREELLRQQRLWQRLLLVVGGIALILWITVSAWQFYSY